MRRLLVAMVLWVLTGTVARAEEKPAPDLRYVSASLVRLRNAPSSDAKVVATLRMGTPVAVTDDSRHTGSGFLRLQAYTDGAAAENAAQPVKGWAHQSLLDAAPPQLDVLLARFEKAESARDKRLWMERAAALAPSDEKVIQKLIETYAAQGNAQGEAAARKGLVAAQKRNRSWDGPLYVVVDGVVRIMGKPCVEGDAPIAQARPARLSTPALRARAFEIVDSGKVVSVTTQGGRTERLNTRGCFVDACGQAHLAYRLPDARDGALVPSWLVAGHRMVGFSPAVTPPQWAPPCESETCRAFVDQNGRMLIQRRSGERGEGRSEWRLVRRTLRGVTATDWQALEASKQDAEPIARFDEGHSELKLLWRAPNGSEACAKEPFLWLVRLRLHGRTGAVEGFVEGARSDAR